MPVIKPPVIDRERRLVERRIKAAKFPTVKSPDSFEFKIIPSVNKARVLELARCEWIERRENVIALGPSGTGKSHVAQWLGLAACQQGANGGAKLDHGSGGMVPSRRSKTLPECQPFPVMGRVGGFTPWSCIARCVWRAGTG